MNEKLKPNLYNVLIGTDLVNENDLSWLKFNRVSANDIPTMMRFAFDQGYEILIRLCED